MRLDKHLVIFLELGVIKVFCWQTKYEIFTKTPYKDVSWQHSATGHTYGPFPTLFDCMKHYAWLVDSQKSVDKTAPVIFVDFIGKKRIIYKLGNMRSLSDA